MAGERKYVNPYRYELEERNHVPTEDIHAGTFYIARLKQIHSIVEPPPISDELVLITSVKRDVVDTSVSFVHADIMSSALEDAFRYEIFANGHIAQDTGDGENPDQVDVIDLGYFLPAPRQPRGQE